MEAAEAWEYITFELLIVPVILTWELQRRDPTNRGCASDQMVLRMREWRSKIQLGDQVGGSRGSSDQPPKELTITEDQCHPQRNGRSDVQCDGQRNAFASTSLSRSSSLVVSTTMVVKPLASAAVYLSTVKNFRPGYSTCDSFDAVVLTGS